MDEAAMARRAPGGEGRKVPLNMKTTEDVREALEDAAKKSGRSLTHEVEYRVGHSIDTERRDKMDNLLVGDTEAAKILRELGHVMAFSREFAKSYWPIDRLAVNEVGRRALLRAIDELMPPAPTEEISNLDASLVDEVSGAAVEVWQTKGKVAIRAYQEEQERIALATERMKAVSAALMEKPAQSEENS